ncbi:MAG: hypothetical protein HYS12_08565 [Planctomycetes bacterium]|nr:hypothetical protein [Planctomycetota bacterium]
MEPVDDELRPEYDETTLKGGVRGKYAKRFAAGTNLVRIDPDLTSAFAGEEAINNALRFVLQLPGAIERLTKRSS